MTKMAYDEDSLLALSGIQHFAYCRRQWALIHIEREWRENTSTVKGKHLHRKVHSMLPTEARGEVIISRSLPLVSYQLGLYGVADVVEFFLVSEDDKDGGVLLPGRSGLWRPWPVEYKKGQPKIDERDEVQLCAQAMCLEEMLNIKVEEGSFFYGKIQHRTNVIFESKLRERVKTFAMEMHQIFEKGIIPMAPDNVNCRLCSLKDICLPRLTKKKKRVENYIKAYVDISD